MSPSEGHQKVGHEEARLRGLLRSVDSLRAAAKNALDEGGHMSLADALSFNKITCPELYATLSSLPERVREALRRALGKISDKDHLPTPHDDQELFGTVEQVLGDCFSAIDQSLDVLNGQAPSICIETRPAKRLKVGLHSSPNLIRPSDSQVFWRKSNPMEEQIKSLDHSSDPLYTEPFLTDSVRNPKSLDLTPYIWVDTEEALQEAISSLSREPVIAVDLENHSYYSFHGFTCLIQISSRKADYIIDAVRLRRELRATLPRLLSSPCPLKILHAAEHDSVWLQRDFDCFLVNVFDSFVAARQLDFPKQSLASLLLHYFGIVLDKQFQLADWRIRPLPAEMLRYARLDTHYLFVLWDRLKEDLLTGKQHGIEALRSVYRKSSHQCLRLYRPEASTSESSEKACQAIINRSCPPLDSLQQAVLKTVYSWRGRIARLEDVCLHAVLPDHWLVRLALSKPTTSSACRLALRNGCTQFVSKNIESLVQEIKTAIDHSLLQTCQASVRNAADSSSHPMAVQTEGSAILKRPPRLLFGRPVSVPAPKSDASPFSSFFQPATRPDKICIVKVPGSVPSLSATAPLEPLTPAEPEPVHATNDLDNPNTVFIQKARQELDIEDVLLTAKSTNIRPVSPHSNSNTMPSVACNFDLKSEAALAYKGIRTEKSRKIRNSDGKGSSVKDKPARSGDRKPGKKSDSRRTKGQFTVFR